MDLPPIIKHLEKEKIVLFPTELCKTKPDRSKIKCKKGKIEAFKLDNQKGYIIKNRSKIGMGQSHICDYLFLPIYNKDTTQTHFFLIEVTNLLWEFVDYKQSQKPTKDYHSFVKKILEEMLCKLYKTLELLCLLDKKIIHKSDTHISCLCHIWNNLDTGKSLPVDVMPYNGCTFVVVVPNAKDAKIQKIEAATTRLYVNLRSRLNKKFNEKFDINSKPLISMINGSVMHSYEKIENKIKEISNSLITATNP